MPTPAPITRLMTTVEAEMRTARDTGEETMRTEPEISIRELDRRTSDGIDVRLLWNPQTNGVSIAVQDERLGESLAFGVEPADALAAFHHPYAYVSDAGPSVRSHAPLKHKREGHEPHLI